MTKLMPILKYSESQDLLEKDFEIKDTYLKRNFQGGLEDIDMGLPNLDLSEFDGLKKNSSNTYALMVLRSAGKNKANTWNKGRVKKGLESYLSNLTGIGAENFGDISEGAIQKFVDKGPGTYSVEQLVNEARAGYASKLYQILEHDFNLLQKPELVRDFDELGSKVLVTAKALIGVMLYNIAGSGIRQEYIEKENLITKKEKESSEILKIYTGFDTLSSKELEEKVNNVLSNISELDNLTKKDSQRTKNFDFSGDGKNIRNMTYSFRDNLDRVIVQIINEDVDHIEDKHKNKSVFNIPGVPKKLMNQIVIPAPLAPYSLK